MNIGEMRILAAMFAVSNMGIASSSIVGIGQLKRDPPKSLDAAIYDLAGPYMESDHAERIFCEEAEMWLKHIETMTEAELRRVHVSIFAAYDAA